MRFSIFRLRALSVALAGVLLGGGVLSSLPVTSSVSQAAAVSVSEVMYASHLDTVDTDNQGRVTYVVSKELFESQNRIVALVDGQIDSEIVSGAVVGGSVSAEDQMVHITSETVRGEDVGVVEVMLLPEAPAGSEVDVSSAYLLGKKGDKGVDFQQQKERDYRDIPAVQISVDERGRIVYTIDQELFNSKNRVVTYVDGKHVAETYGGKTFRSSAVSDAGVSTVTSAGKVSAGSRIDVVVVGEGKPNSRDDISAGYLLATLTLQGGEDDGNDGNDGNGSLGGQIVLSQNRSNVVEMVMRRDLFDSNSRVVVSVNKEYVGETYAGTAYYSGRINMENTVKLTYSGRVLKPGDVVEVSIVAGVPGESITYVSSGVLARLVIPGGKGSGNNGNGNNGGGSADAVMSQLSVSEASTQLVLHPRSFVENYTDHYDAMRQDTTRKNVWMPLNTWEPASRFVRSGEEITVVLPEGTPGVELVVGQFGPHGSANGGAEKEPSRVAIAGGTTRAIADQDGLVYLSKVGGEAVDATVSGGVPVPTYALGQSTPEEFAKDMQRFNKAPFAMLISEHTYAPMQRHIVEKHLSHIHDERLLSWDHVVAVTDETYGLSRTATGNAYREPSRIHIANADSGAGYAHATWYRIAMHNEHGAGEHLLSAPYTDQWGLWHEIGHTYQTPQYRWDGMTEVTVNISSLAVQKSLGGKSSLENADTQKAIADFLGRANGDRNYHALTDPFAKLGLFDELGKVAGDDFYPNLSREYRSRVHNVAGFEKSVETDEQKQQMFMQIASEVAQKNLTPLFAKWGLPMTDETRSVLGGYPAM